MSRVLHPDSFITDFPRVPDSLVGSFSRYMYAGCIHDNSNSVQFTGIIKVDLEAKGDGPQRSVVADVKFGDGCFGGEAVFAPGLGQQEDDGYLMTYVYSTSEARALSRYFYYPFPWGLRAPLALSPLGRELPSGLPRQGPGPGLPHQDATEGPLRISRRVDGAQGARHAGVTHGLGYAARVRIARDMRAILVETIRCVR